MIPSILSAYIVPHPPLIVPAVGGGRESEIQATVNAYRSMAEEVASLKPETVIIITPHSVMYSDYIHISPGSSASGSFARFGAPREKLSARYDTELADAICEIAAREDIPAGKEGERDRSLDHGTMIPLYFIDSLYGGHMTVRVSVSGLSVEEHYRLGMCIQEAVRATGRRAVVVGSGDLSHKLLDGGPYGFAPEGPVFDGAVTDAMRKAAFGDFLRFEPDFCEKAAECGLCSFVVMAGALDRLAVETRFGSYEGTFGVGYAVCGYTVTGADAERNFLERYAAEQAAKLREIKSGEDIYVSLARLTLETYIKEGRVISRPEGLPRELTDRAAGVFVSLKKYGELRGCIGTVAPARENIADEIIANAISAGARDPRFPAVAARELDALVYSVDVLLPPEPAVKAELDPMKYGVIVTKGRKRGLLLPNLEGVDTVERQLAIALQKAGIPTDEQYKTERFEVVRHR